MQSKDEELNPKLKVKGAFNRQLPAQSGGGDLSINIMSKLKAKDPKDAAPSKPKILIFGKPGVGKTWQALDFPSVYYIDTEGGADLPHYTDKLHKSGGVYLGPQDGSLDFPTVIDQFKALATEKHSYKTVVVDSLSKLFNTAIAIEAERMEREGQKNAFAADKKPAIAFLRRLVSWVARLDMNVIFIAHSKSEWAVDNKGEKVEIGQTFDCWDKLEYELHLALEITKQGPRRSAKVRKTRLIGFPEGDVFTWSYAEFSQRYGKDIIEMEVKPVILATSEQVSEIERLVALLKVDPATVEKWKTKANAETFAEFNTEHATGVITFLTQQINPTK